jgi:amino acid adenylation domain-containing protein
VLTKERFSQQMAGCSDHVVDLEEAREEIEKQSGGNLRLQLDPENLAWVIYTSSSTGRPKGMAIPHRSAVSMQQQRTLIDAIDQNPSVERLLNLCAPTEDTTYSAYVEVQDDGTGLMMIGRSQSNTQAYVLDGHMKLVPVGIKGELYLGGARQARGYLNRPELTAEKFVPNPFSKTSGERLYRTDDLVRCHENGNLEFLGRLDDQVKIQGYRIEPGEIEAAMLDYPGVTQATVIARGDKSGNVRLAGYVAGSERLDVDRLRSHLQQRVPEYMVPAALLQLDTMPLTTNGKADRKALLELESKKAMEAGSLALTPTEELIAGVWSSLLGKPEIRRDDNFFDLGGHSLTSIQMLARVEQVFHREIELPAIFEFPVLKDFSGYVDRLTGPAPLATLLPIVPTSRDGRLPLSFAQQRLWFLGQMEGASAAYHIPFGLHLKSDLNRAALRRTLDRIVVRHEVLRTTFAVLDGEPVQEIGAVEASSFRLLEHDLRGHNEVEVEAELAALRGLEAEAPFDLAAGPLIRGRLIRLAEAEHVLLITMHHIVSDGWSMGVLVRELNALYGAFLGGGADPLPELEIQYADYAVWQRQWIEGEILQQQAAYWKTTLAGAPALLELPTDHTRPVQRDFAGGFVELVLDEQLTAGLKDLSRRQGTTLYMTLLAGWAILLARLSGQQDVVIGSPVANRGRTEIENLIGFFVNTLAVRLDMLGSPSVSELLEQTKAQSLAAQRHQDIPFEQVVDLLRPVRSLAHSPLFQVMFAWQNAAEARLELPGLEVQPFEPSPHRVAKFDMTLSLQAADDTIGGVIEYASALFEAASVHRYIGYFLALLKAMVADDAQTIDRLPMLSEGEREQVLYEWNDTGREYPRDKCVHELFEEQVRRNPEITAVAFEEEELSYGELNARANRLAHYLRELGVKPDERVAICVERGLDMMVGLLGVLKAGAAYVPLDPGSVRERLKYMVEDSGAKLVLSSRSLSPEIREVAGPEVLLMEAEEWHRYSSENPQVHMESAQLAYVIYTSGSTGRPKGVGVEHRQLVSYVRAIGERLQIEPGMRLGLVSTHAADLGYTMIFPALCYGGCLDVVEASRVLDASKLEEHFSRHPIDYLKIVPSHMRALLNSNVGSGFLPRRWLVLGGESSSWDLIQQVKGRGAGCQVLNHYGPTETTVGVLTYDTTQNDGGPQVGGMVPIGRPLSNGKVYVLDSELNPVGVGVSGEIYIAGAGVARGYLKREDLTAEKFLPNPYSTEPGGRMYRTGDLGRYLENGNVEFLGRRDHQVKIRGFRIELGEIEARLAEHPEVREAVVLAREDEPGDKRLVAYYTASGIDEAEAASVGAERLRAHLSAVLPDYMVPAAYVRMERLPLMPNGKLDRKALPMPEQEAYAARRYEAPVGEIETKLAEVWAEVLHLEKVGRHDNFFDLGGHSLLAVRVVSRLQRVLSVEVAIRDLFAHAELADLARHLQGAAHAELSRIMPAKRSGRLPLSFAQQRLWFLAQMEGASAAYHIPFGLHLKGDLNRTALRRALDRIVVRHEVLRTTFALRDGEPVQEIGAVEASSFRLLEYDLRGHNDVEAELAALRELEAEASFDLEAGPLIRGRLIRLAEDEHVLLITMHHIVSDGWSTGVLVRELKAFYGAFLGRGADPLPELEIQYADYAVWQRQWIEGEILQQQAAYWKTTLAGAPALLELLTDHPRPVQQSYAGAMLPVVLEEKLTSGLKGLSRRQGTTLYMTLLAGWAILLARLSGQQDVVIGSPVANRGRTEIENLIGFFVNTLALRLDLSGSPSVSELLEQTKAQSLAAQRHQDIPFEQVVDLLQPVRSLTHSPLFQVMFAWQNATESPLELPDLELQPFVSSSHRVAKFDMTLSLVATGDTIGGGIEYASALFEAASVHRYIGYFLALLKAMVADDAQTIDCLPMLSEGEREQVLYEWNDTEREYPRDKCVHKLFEEQVRRSPQAAAVIYEEERLSYGELNERANQLAWRLRELGVGPEARVGLLAERSLEMVVGLLGVLKAGAAYVPLDPDYPSERLSYMLESARVKVLLTQEHLREQRPPYSGPVLELDGAEERRRIAEQNRWNLDVALMAEHLAYIIYTSGSTGRPKGVMNSHGGLLNRLLWMQKEYRLEPGDVVLQKTPFSFDVSVWEFLWPLMEGAKLVVARPRGHQDPDYLATLIEERQVTTLHFVPSMLAVFLDEERPKQCKSIRRVVCSGEALPAELAQRCLASLPWAELHNLYGPTEAAIDVTYWKCLAEDTRASVPIGKAIANIRLYVVDEAMNPVPVGVPGELYLGGVGLARGYWGRGDLTAARFVPDGLSGRMGERLYRTGDLVRWLVDGNLEYLGRLDQQVKIRGFRIELGEIEAALERHPSVTQAVVLAREDKPGDKRLVAYVVADQEAEEDDSGNKKAGLWISELREHLLGQLPEYMVPTAYVQLKRIPLTPNGKIDRQGLPPAAEQPSTKASLPLDEVEESLLMVWQKALGKENVGVDDNYFALGGDSLRVVQVVHEARRHGIDVRVMDVLRHQTIRALRKALQQGRRSELFPHGVPEALLPETQHMSSLPSDAIDFYPVSAIQAFVLQKYAENQGADGIYHIQECFHLEDQSFSRDALEKAFAAVVERHPAMRTVLDLKSLPPLQCIRRELPWKVLVTDISHLDISDQEAYIAEQIVADRTNLFDPANKETPLFRIVLFLRSPIEFSVFFSCHHAIMDGWGHQIFLGHLLEAYTSIKSGRAPDLGKPDNTYHEFVNLEHAIGRSEQAAQFWSSYLSGVQFPPLPGFVLPASDEANDPKIVSVLEPEQNVALEQIVREHAVSAQALLLAAWLEVLRRWSGDSVVTTGVISNGRSEYLADPLSSVGLFWNVAPVVSRKELPVLQQAEVVQKDLIALQPYASYPLLQLMAGNGGEELFYSAFRYLNFWNSKQIPKESGLRHQGSYMVDRYPFALTCTAGVIPSGRYLQLEYNPKAVSLGFAENLLNSYKTLLDEITQAVK